MTTLAVTGAVPFRRATWLLALAVGGLGIMVEAGWYTGNTILKAGVPGIVAMNPLTALSFVLGAVALVLLTSQRLNAGAQLFIQLTGLFMIAVGALRMLGIVFGIDLHHDQLLYHAKMLAVTDFGKNRIAPNTSVNFVLIGSAFCLASLRRSYGVVQGLAFTTFMIALLAIVGYAYSVKNLYGFLSYTPMALNTALAFSLTAVGIWCATYGEGFMRVVAAPTAGGVTARRLMPAIILIPVVIGWLGLYGQQRGWYNTEYDMSIVVIATTFAFIMLIYGVARSLDMLDTARLKIQDDLRQSEVRLQQANAALDKKLSERGQQNDSLEKTKIAMLNIMEDLEQTKSRIEQEKAKDDALLASIGDGLIATDETGTIISTNEQAAVLLHTSVKDMIGKNFDDVWKIVGKDGLAVAKPKRPITAALTRGIRVAVSDYWYVREDGTKFPIAETVSPIILDGKIAGVINVFRDVTREKDIDRAKSEFVSLASHQLRTPLSTINWYSEMLLAGDAGTLSDEQRQFMDEIYHGNQRMVDLVNALLNVSRIDLGTFAIEPAPTNIIEIADSVLKEMMPQIQAKETKIVKEYAGDVPIISADPKLVRIIIQNLLTNAVKYTPPKGTVTISIEQKDSDLLIRVADTGYGIPKSQQDKIFTKLFRADNVREKETDGTGLGLYIIKSIVEGSGGKVWFESEENKGTTFHVTIPLSGMKAKQGTKGLT